MADRFCVFLVLCAVLLSDVVFCQFGFSSPWGKQQNYNFNPFYGAYEQTPYNRPSNPVRFPQQNQYGYQDYYQPQNIYRPARYPPVDYQDYPNPAQPAQESGREYNQPIIIAEENPNKVYDDAKESTQVNGETDGEEIPKKFPANVNNGGDSTVNFDARFNEAAKAIGSNTALTPAPKSEGSVNFVQFQNSCNTVDGGTGLCTTFANCPMYVSLLQTNPRDPAVTDMLRRAFCGFDGNNPKVCCPSQVGFPVELPTSPSTTQATTPVTEPEIDKPRMIGDNVFLTPPACGVSNASFSRVVGGVPAKLGDFPWMALLGYRGRGEGGPRWLCGGSLISSRHVLTASHCVHGRENLLYIVRLGELDLERDDDGATPIDVPIARAIKHENYDSKAFTNDIAVLVLEYEVKFTPLIQPICIPIDPELRARTFEKYRPIIAGWGDTEYRGQASPHLQVLQIPVVTNEYCAKAYVQYKAQKIDERVLCAGYEKGGKDSCQGDSGGPLMQPVYNSKTFKTYFYQIGVVSFGKKCAEPGFPGVYSRVTYFVPWLEKILQNN